MTPFMGCLLPVSGCPAAPPELAYMFILDGNHEHADLTTVPRLLLLNWNEVLLLTLLWAAENITCFVSLHVLPHLFWFCNTIYVEPSSVA